MMPRSVISPVTRRAGVTSKAGLATGEPGETTRLTEYADYQIAFDRGENFGTARYTIYEGAYEFTPTEKGWELYRQKSDESLTAEERDASAPRGR